jgi:hypothetical protein
MMRPVDTRSHPGVQAMAGHVGATLQRRTGNWVETAFGKKAAGDINERNCRFFEEASELVQVTGLPREFAHQLVDYVYDRPVGELRDEIGGTVLTLMALCNAVGQSALSCGDDTLAKAWENIAKIRAKRATKPEFGPLPGVAP